MNTKRTLLTAIVAVVVAFTSTLTQASAQATPAAVGVVHGTMDGHAYRTGDSAGAAPIDMEGGLPPYDLQLILSEGRHKAPATGVKVTITGTAGPKVFSLGNAGALTDIDRPAGRCHIVADLGHVKRLGSVDVEKGELATLHLHGPNDPT